MLAEPHVPDVCVCVSVMNKVDNVQYKLTGIMTFRFIPTEIHGLLAKE